MNKSVEALLESFDRLPDEAKRDAASEIIRRAVKLRIAPLEDDALVEAAENLFLELDQRESKHG